MNLFTEYPEANEQKYCDRTVKLVQQQMELLDGDASKAPAKRDTHAKTHVCVQEILEIFDFDEAAIKAELAQKTDNKLTVESRTENNIAQAKTLATKGTPDNYFKTSKRKNFLNP